MSVPRPVFWLLVALAAVGAGWGFWSAGALRSQLDLVRIERDLAVVSERLMRTEMSERTLLAERMINELAAEARASDLSRVDVVFLGAALENARAARGLLLSTTSPQRAVLRAERLPVLAAEATYQLWHRPRADAAAVSVATFRPDARGTAILGLPTDAPLAPDAEYFVTLEAAAGAAQPAGPTVLRTGP